MSMNRNRSECSLNPAEGLTRGADRSYDWATISDESWLFWEDRARFAFTRELLLADNRTSHPLDQPGESTLAAWWLRELQRTMPHVGAVHLQVSPGPLLRDQILAPMMAACFYGRPVVVDWRHRFADIQFEAAGRFSFWILRHAARVLVSTENLDARLKRHGVRSVVLPPSINLTDLQPRTIDKVQPNILASLAVEGDDYSSPIGWQCLIQGFQLVKAKYPRAELTLLIEGLSPDQIANGQRTVPSGVTLVPPHDQGAVDACYAEADCFVNAAPVSNPIDSVVRALAEGLPTISTRVGSIPEIITDGQNGLLFRSDQPATLARAIVRLIETPELVQSLSESASTTGASFGWQLVAQRWQRALEIH